MSEGVIIEILMKVFGIHINIGIPFAPLINPPQHMQ